MKNPTSAEILDLLISLYAEQEGVKIKYELEVLQNE
jgi:hypothetical protein